MRRHYNYAVDIDLVNGVYIRDLEYDSIQEARKVYDDLADSMEYKGEDIDNVQLVRVYSDGEYEVVQSIFSN